MTSNKYHLVLASGSPRRKEIISWLGIPFSIHSSNVEEVTNKKIPNEVAVELAKLKGRDVLSQKSDNALVIASDTVVALNGKVYGKPDSTEVAREMLLELAGVEHEVITAVYLGTKQREHTFYCSSLVTFDEIDEELLELYLATGDSLDKAGAYGIQGQALVFISHLNGSYSNVVGFPISHFVKELSSFLGCGPSSWKDIFLNE